MWNASCPPPLGGEVVFMTKNVDRKKNNIIKIGLKIGLKKIKKND
jgi:hypothetical protein